MPIDSINGVKIFWETSGDRGEPLVLVHGSWGDHHNWDMVVPELAKSFRVITYDRRGHSQSERPSGQGRVEEDIDDLIALINHLNLSPAHIIGNSFGAAIVLKTAVKQPSLFKTMIVHEPPLFGIIADNPKAQEALQAVNERIKAVLELFAKGDLPKATEEFMEKIAMGEGEWKKLPEAAQKTFIYNAPTWFDEIQDPQSLQMDISTLAGFRQPALLSVGTKSPPFFPLVIDKIFSVMPDAAKFTIEGAGHVPHMSHPARYFEMVNNFIKTP